MVSTYYLMISSNGSSENLDNSRKNHSQDFSPYVTKKVGIGAAVSPFFNKNIISNSIPFFAHIFNLPPEPQEETILLTNTISANLIILFGFVSNARLRLILPFLIIM